MRDRHYTHTFCYHLQVSFSSVGVSFFVGALARVLPDMCFAFPGKKASNGQPASLQRLLGEQPPPKQARAERSAAPKNLSAAATEAEAGWHSIWENENPHFRQLLQAVLQMQRETAITPKNNLATSPPNRTMRVRASMRLLLNSSHVLGAISLPWVVAVTGPS